MSLSAGFKSWLHGPTSPASSYLIRFRAGCPPIGEELSRRGGSDEIEDDDKERGMCATCEDTLESRAHFLLDCPAYAKARQEMMIALKELIDPEEWKASQKWTPARRALWLLSGCRTAPVEGAQYIGTGSENPWESDCCLAVSKYLQTAMTIRYASANPLEVASESSQLSRLPVPDAVSSDPSDSDPSVEGADTANLSSKHLLAGSMANIGSRARN